MQEAQLSQLSLR